MRVPISWLKEYVDIDITAEELAEDPLVRKVYLGQHFELRRKLKEQ